jgi:hypothetical protein
MSFFANVNSHRATNSRPQGTSSMPTWRSDERCRPILSQARKIAGTLRYGSATKRLLSSAKTETLFNVRPNARLHVSQPSAYGLP